MAKCCTTARAAASDGVAALRKDPPRDHLWLAELAPGLMAVYAVVGAPDAAIDRYRELPRHRKLDARYEAWKAAQPPAG